VGIRQLAARAAAAGGAARRARRLAHAVLAEEAMLGQRLGRHGEFTDAVAALLETLEGGGVTEAVRAVCDTA
jgi:hypothetical protein